MCAELARPLPLTQCQSSAANSEPDLHACAARRLCVLPQELQLAAAHGVPQDRIIFANPCKRPADFRCAVLPAPALSCLPAMHCPAATHSAIQLARFGFGIGEVYASCLGFYFSSHGLCP